MTKLLINEYPLLILPSLAKVIGLNEAIVLQQLHYWLNQPNVGVIHDGRKWVHNTYEEWHTNFPFWSVDTVKRTLQSLERMGLVLSAQFAPNPFDKTKSYSIEYGQVELYDGGKLPSSITETTVSDTNNTASDENQSSCRHCGLPIFYDERDTLWFHVRKTGRGDNGYYCAGESYMGKHADPKPEPSTLPIEWQVLAGVDKIVMPDEKDAQMIDSANLIAMGKGTDYHIAYGIAYAFMRTRGIVIPASQVKGQRKAVRNMMEQGVLPNHVEAATKKLMDAKMTVADLYSIAKTAIALANPPEENYDGALEGV